MREILVTGGEITLVDDEDYPMLSKYGWFKQRSRCGDGKIYVGTSVKLGPKNWKSVTMHRMILGVEPRVPVDHIDGDPFNNQRSNLRVVTHGLNRANSLKKKGRWRYKGAYLKTKESKWEGQIRVNKNLISLGLFPDEESAARAYDDAARKYFGEHARVNFPNQGERGCLEDSS